MKLLRLGTEVLPGTRFHMRGLDMKYIAGGCSLGIVMSMVVGSLITPRVALADLRVDRVEDRGERLKKR